MRATVATRNDGGIGDHAQLDGQARGRCNVDERGGGATETDAVARTGRRIGGRHLLPGISASVRVLVRRGVLREPSGAMVLMPRRLRRVGRLVTRRRARDRGASPLPHRVSGPRTMLPGAAASEGPPNRRRPQREDEE